MMGPLVLAVAAGCATAGRGGDGRTERGAFIARLGNDTVSVERYTRTRDSLAGDFLTRSPRTRIVHYVARLAPDGSITRIDFSSRPMTQAADGPRPQSGFVTIGADSVRSSVTAGDQPPRTGVLPAQAGTVPMIGYVWALYEQGARQARAAAGDSIAVPFAWVGARELTPTPYVKVGADSMTIAYFGPLYRARVDAAGRLLGVDGLGTTNKVIVERLPDADIEAIAQRFAAADAGGRALGQLSPRDSVRTTIGDAHLAVDYSRPSIRGRQMMGLLIPYNQVWRTGANAATTFTTDADLMVNGVPVPAGKYTLWTISTPQGTKLIVNKQTGQWGTEYDETKDLARIDMTRETAATPAEQFTIAIHPQGEGGLLRMHWGTTQFSVPFTVAR